jgi:hypothetical protein
MYKREGNISLINDIYSKCLNQNQDISNKIHEIQSGQHNYTIIDKVRQKIEEKLENHSESVKLGEKIITELSRDEAMIWSK